MANEAQPTTITEKDSKVIPVGSKKEKDAIDFIKTIQNSEIRTIQTSDKVPSHKVTFAASNDAKENFYLMIGGMFVGNIMTLLIALILYHYIFLRPFLKKITKNKPN